MLLTGSSLTIPVGWALRLRCSALSNPPANLSWVRGPPDLQPTPVSFTDILELPQVQSEYGGQVTCIAQNSLGSQHLSVNLSVQGEFGPGTGGAEGHFPAIMSRREVSC